MNLLKCNETFEFFPALKLNLLRDTSHAQFNLLGCNMQIPSLKINNQQINALALSKTEKRKRKQKLQDISSDAKNLVNIKESLYFYTGLKQYYKVNIKKEILADYFVEEKKNMLYMNQQFKTRSAYLSGDSIFPVKRSYEFLKRRFIISLHLRQRLKTKEALVEKFSHIVNDINNRLLGSLILTLHEKKELPQLSFYQTGLGKNNSGKLFHFLGISRIFMKWNSVFFRYDFIHTKHVERYKPYDHRFFITYLVKYLPNRHFYFLQFVLTNMNKRKITNLIDIDQMFFLREVIREFMSIKFYLRFFLARSWFYYDHRVIKPKMRSYYKLFFSMFNLTKIIYKNIFEWIFNLCAVQIISIVDQQTFSINSSENLKLAHIYCQNVPSYKITIFPLSFTTSGRKLSFSNFRTGVVTKQRTTGHFKIFANFYRYRSRIYFHLKNNMSTRYRRSLYLRRSTLLEKNNPNYYLEELKNNIDLDFEFE